MICTEIMKSCANLSQVYLLSLLKHTNKKIIFFHYILCGVNKNTNKFVTVDKKSVYLRAIAQFSPKSEDYTVNSQSIYAFFCIKLLLQIFAQMRIYILACRYYLCALHCRMSGIFSCFPQHVTSQPILPRMKKAERKVSLDLCCALRIN